MIHHIVKFALRQRFLMMMLVVLLIAAGSYSFLRCPWTLIRIFRRPWSNWSRSGRAMPPKRWSG